MKNKPSERIKEKARSEFAPCYSDIETRHIVYAMLQYLDEQAEKKENFQESGKTKKPYRKHFGFDDDDMDVEIKYKTLEEVLAVLPGVGVGKTEISYGREFYRNDAIEAIKKLFSN